MNKMSRSQDFDSYEIEEPSDEERAESSSEDELEILLNGTPQQKRKLLREYLTGESESSSADEFEKEMEAELSSTIRSLEGTWGPESAAATTAETPGGGGGGEGAGGNPQMYDKVYFDSDSEEEDTAGSSTGRRRRQRTVLTNDELLYDPDEDDRDQAWVDNKRRQYHRRRPGAAGVSQSRGLSSSDAVLNCPACMTTLCLDCQRHEKYRTQYRAMFVMNCTVKKDEVLRYKTQPERNRKFKNRRKRKVQKTQTEPGLSQDQETENEPGPNQAQKIENEPGPNQAQKTQTEPGPNQAQERRLKQDQEPGPAGLDSDELYHPVQCSECSTEVAVFDKDEVYHFFNILASHC